MRTRAKRSRVMILARLGYLIEAAAALAREGRRVVIQVDTAQDSRRLRILVKVLHPTLTLKIRVSGAHGQALMDAQVAEARAIQGRARRPRARHPGLGTNPKPRIGRVELLRLLAEAPQPVDDFDMVLTEDLWWRKEIEFTDLRAAGAIMMILTPQGYRAVRKALIAPPPAAPQTCSRRTYGGSGDSESDPGGRPDAQKP